MDGRVPNWECVFVHRKQGYTWTTSKWLEESRKRLTCGRNWWNMWILTNPHHFLTMYTWDVLSVNANQMKQLSNNIRRCLNHVFLLEQLKKLPGWEMLHAKTVAWSYDVEGHAQKCVERYCQLAKKKVEQLYRVSSPCSDDHQFKQEELESVGELSEVCSQIVLKCLYLARIGRPDILWSVNKLAR